MFWRVSALGFEEVEGLQVTEAVPPGAVCRGKGLQIFADGKEAAEGLSKFPHAPPQAELSRSLGMAPRLFSSFSHLFSFAGWCFMTFSKRWWTAEVMLAPSNPCVACGVCTARGFKGLHLASPLSHVQCAVRRHGVI